MTSIFAWVFMILGGLLLVSINLAPRGETTDWKELTQVSWKARILLNIVPLLLFGASWFIFDQAKTESKLQPTQQELSVSFEKQKAVNGAWTAATMIVRDRLKSPSTAKFPSFDPKFVRQLDSVKYRVASYVDSQNGFGAIVRTQFTCVVKEGHDSWELDAINFNEGQ